MEKDKNKITNFHCSEHGYITPKPECPNCKNDTLSTLLKEVEGMKKKMEECRCEVDIENSLNGENCGCKVYDYNQAIDQIINLIKSKMQ